VSGSEATVSIVRLGLELAVVAGGQDVIDDGLVAHYWAPGWREPAAAGAGGTYWLAAHRQTHGSPFLRLPDVVVGDQIDITTATQTFTYTVTFTEVVNDDAGFGPVYGTDLAAPVILLQTCLDHVRRLLVHGDLTASAWHAAPA
jgi:LPXTG-site transpeptidase (sortase) family protein